MHDLEIDDGRMTGIDVVATGEESGRFRIRLDYDVDTLDCPSGADPYDSLELARHDAALIAQAVLGSTG